LWVGVGCCGCRLCEFVFASVVVGYINPWAINPALMMPMIL
jgi:hypothetical protein